jgi:hypothetical protein
MKPTIFAYAKHYCMEELLDGYWIVPGIGITGCSDT